MNIMNEILCDCKKLSSRYCFTQSCKHCCKNKYCHRHNNDHIHNIRKVNYTILYRFSKIEERCKRCKTYRSYDGCKNNHCKSCCCNDRGCIAHKDLIVTCEVCNTNRFDKECIENLCMSCCKSKDCFVHKDKCVSCKKTDRDDGCNHNECNMCCDRPLCLIHFEHHKFKKGRYRGIQYEEILESFRMIMKASDLLNDELIDHIFDRFVDERKTCSLCCEKIIYNENSLSCDFCGRNICFECMLETEFYLDCEGCDMQFNQNYYTDDDSNLSEYMNSDAID